LLYEERNYLYRPNELAEHVEVIFNKNTGGLLTGDDRPIVATR